jgi:hypothetical protein
MAASATTTNQSNILFRMNGTKLAEPLLKASRLVNRMKKSTDFGGEDKTIHVKVAATGGGGGSFEEALAAQKASQHVRFVVTHRPEYQLFTIQGQAVARSKGKKAALLEIVNNESKSARYAYARSVAHKAWGTGGGARGRIANTVFTGAVATLVSSADHVFFEVGMKVGFSVDNGAVASPAGLRGAPTYLTVTSVDRGAGTVTFDAVLSTVAAIATNDYMFRVGDYGNAMTGIDGWCPRTAPSASESFFGVDRTQYDPQRVSGFRYTANAGGQMEESLIAAAAEADMCGIAVKGFYVSSRQYAKLLIEMGSSRQRTNKGDGAISYNSLVLVAPNGDGEWDIMGDKDVPDGFGWGLDESEISLETAGSAPDLLNHDGGGPLRQLEGSDAVQGRIGSYGNFFHENPGNSLIVQF